MASKNSARRYLAFDFGAESGRAVVGSLADGKLQMEEIHRFANEPVEICDTLHWDILSLYGNLLKGAREYVRRYGSEVAGIAVDTWGVDFGLLGRDGKLLQNPACYRDRRTEGMVARAQEMLSDRELFNQTGMSTLSIHTVFQLLSLRVNKSPLLDVATRFLMMPDLFGYFLTGVECCERTDAITSQLYDPRTGEWSREVFEALDLPLKIMPELCDPGTVLGELRQSVREATGLESGTVLSVCGHDTGAAVAAVPAHGNEWAFISSGTWSILGALSGEVFTTDEAYAGRMVNELTVDGLFLARNIMGLWLLQQSRAAWAREGSEHSYDDLVRLGGEAPEGGPLLFPDDAGFLAPPDMPAAIRDYCLRTGQTPPDGVGATVRCILESLALIYRADLERMSRILGRKLDVLHIVGGGSQNSLLCQFAADANGIPVLAGPVETTVAGNILTQALALGDLGSPDEMREVVKRSFDLVEYQPRDREAWDARYEEYVGLQGK